MKNRRNAKGITLIALVLTVIILILLVEVSYLTATNLVIEKATLASAETMQATKEEMEELNWYNGEEEDRVYLKENVKVGEYIAYPIKYDDSYTKEHYTLNNAWRVIEDGSSGPVKIISTGIPVQWMYFAGNNSLIENFENLTRLRNANKDYVNMKSFKIDNMADKMENLSLAYLNRLCNEIYGTSRSENELTPLNETHELFYLSDLGSYYWLATKDVENTAKLYCVSGYAGFESIEGFRLGVRPVISLKENLTGIFEDGVWKNIR